MKAEDFLKEKSSELNPGIFRTSLTIYGNSDILKAFHRHQNQELIEKFDMQSNLHEKYRQKTDDLIDKNKELIKKVMFLKADVEAKQKTVNSLYKYITDLKAILSNDNQKT